MPTCLYCHAPMEGVEVLEYGIAALEAYLNIGVLYVHKTCHEERIPVDLMRSGRCWWNPSKT